MNDSATAQVAELYDSPSGQLGPILFGGHLHWGYWDQASADADFGTAADRLAQIMIDTTGIGAGQKFIDLGCGVGLAARKLAKARQCQVEGITISRFQQQSASEQALAAGMQDQVSFMHGSALEIPRPDQTYDGGWFFESIFHMGHRAALREATRVLKPGALLSLTDLPILPGTTEEFKSFVQKHIHSGFISLDDYPALLAETGFELVELRDITANVMPWLASKLRETLDRHQQQIHDIAPAITEKDIEDWVYLFEYMSENLGYILLTLRKR
jgi:cyclopropane fatty-acyl-phospholipid synthase-like methyltransferase